MVAEVTNVPACKRDFYTTVITLQALYMLHFFMVLPHWGKVGVFIFKVIHSYLQKMQN